MGMDVLPRTRRNGGQLEGSFSGDSAFIRSERVLWIGYRDG